MKNELMPEKKIKIFNALFELIKRGEALDNIKVSDIAAEADIGKGTVYQYFESKEQIIGQALMYHISSSASSIIGTMRQSDTFEKRVCSVMDTVERRIQLIPSSLDLLFFNIGVSSMKEYLKDERERLENFHLMITDEFNELIELGISDGVIDSNIDFNYARHVFSSAMMGYFSAVSCERHDKADILSLKKYTYKMIVNSLK